MSIKFFSFACALAAFPVLFSSAQLVPTAPGPGSVFKEGDFCPINWIADTTGQWKNTFIELMDGANDPMHHLTTVAQVDGTDSTKTSLTITCPKVTVHSAIYFYQFTAAGQNTTWTTRFAISDVNGGTTPPANAKQPSDGSSIPWGIGQLVNGGTAPPPTAPAGQVDDSNASSGGSTSSTPAASNNTTSLLLAAAPTSTGTSTSAFSSSTASGIVSVQSASFGAATSSASTAMTTTTSTGSGSPSPSSKGNGAVANSISAVFGSLVIAAVFGAAVFY